MFANGTENCQLMMWKMLHAYNSSTLSLDVHYIVFSANSLGSSHWCSSSHIICSSYYTRTCNDSWGLFKAELAKIVVGSFKWKLVHTTPNWVISCWLVSPTLLPLAFINCIMLVVVTLHLCSINVCISNFIHVHTDFRGPGVSSASSVFTLKPKIVDKFTRTVSSFPSFSWGLDHGTEGAKLKWHKGLALVCVCVCVCL